MRVLFFGNFEVLQHKGRVGPSSIVRVTNIAHALTRKGYDCSIQYVSGRYYKENKESILRSDIVVFHRIQASRHTWIEPSFVALFLLAKRFRKKVVFDFDDAIFLTFPALCDFFVKFADAVFAGSHSLLSHARLLNQKTYLIPSAVDTDLFSPPKDQIQTSDQTVIVGWHGTALGHFRNLKQMKPVLSAISKNQSVTFKLLGSEGSQTIHDYFDIPNVNLILGPKQWIPYNQLPLYLGDVDIGISPLIDDVWNRAKCAMKAIEYMSLGKPVVASNVGEHKYIIKNGLNGFLAKDGEQWVDILNELIRTAELRRKVGKFARRTAVESFSLDRVSKKIRSLLEGL